MRPVKFLRVLSVSDHDAVGMSRELLLQNAGYSVVSMSSDGATREEIPRDVEIAIIDQTVDDSSASRIVSRLRATLPNIRIIRVTEMYSPAGSVFDAACSVEDGPEVFLSRVAKVSRLGVGVR